MFFGAGNSGNTSAMNVICFFPYSLSKGKLKDGFLDIYLTMFFGAGISGNTSTSSFFEKCLKFNIDFKNEKKIEKLFVLEKISTELVALNCVY